MTSTAWLAWPRQSSPAEQGIVRQVSLQSRNNISPHRAYILMGLAKARTCYTLVS